MVENRGPGYENLLRKLFPHTGRALTVGITGAPGSGKSTLVSRIVSELRRQDKIVAVVAVDPSSPFSGGAILGDRVRMTEHHEDPGVFVRSMATRGRLGGLSAAASDITSLLDAAGHDFILLETVGVGQSEVDVARIADLVVVVLTPGSGDEVQAMKAGIMEIAGIFVLNKADQPGIDDTERELHASLALGSQSSPVPPVVRCSALDGTGVADVLAAIQTVAADVSRDQSVSTWRMRLLEMYRERAVLSLPSRLVDEAAEAVAARRRNPWAVVEDWITGAMQR